jgi:hypothetical protein
MYRKKWRAEEEERHKRPIRNFTTGPQWWTWPPGVNLAPRGEIRVNVHPFIPPPGVNTLYYLEEWRISPQWDNFTPGDKVRPVGQSLSLGAKVPLTPPVCPQVVARCPGGSPEEEAVPQSSRRHSRKHRGITFINAQIGLSLVMGQ